MTTQQTDRHVILSPGTGFVNGTPRRRSCCTCGWRGPWRSPSTLTNHRDGVEHKRAMRALGAEDDLERARRLPDTKPRVNRSMDHWADTGRSTLDPECG